MRIGSGQRIRLGRRDRCDFVSARSGNQISHPTPGPLHSRTAMRKVRFAVKIPHSLVWRDSSRVGLERQRTVTSRSMPSLDALHPRHSGNARRPLSTDTQDYKFPLSFCHTHTHQHAHTLSPLLLLCVSRRHATPVGGGHVSSDSEWFRTRSCPPTLDQKVVWTPGATGDPIPRQTRRRTGPSRPLQH
jgi:hypothetical protein